MLGTPNDAPVATVVASQCPGRARASAILTPKTESLMHSFTSFTKWCRGARRGHCRGTRGRTVAHARGRDVGCPTTCRFGCHGHVGIIFIFKFIGNTIIMNICQNNVFLGRDRGLAGLPLGLLYTP